MPAFKRFGGGQGISDRQLREINNNLEDLQSQIDDLSLNDVNIGDLSDNRILYKSGTLNKVITGNSFYYDGSYVGFNTIPAIGVDFDISGFLLLRGDVHIDGSLTIMGTNTSINTQTLEVSNNYIVINEGLQGVDPPPTLKSGIIVNRGNFPDYMFEFSEEHDLFRVGITGSDMNPVAERQLMFQDRAIPIWDGSGTYQGRLTYNAGFVMDADGNLGVGTSNPQALLDVSGNAIIRGDISMVGFNSIDIYFPTDVSGINERVRDISANLDGFSQNLADLSGVVDTNTSNIADLSQNLADLSGVVDINIVNIADLSQNLADLSGVVDTNTSNIADISQNLVDLSGVVDTNIVNIADLSQNLADLSGVVDTNIGNIADISQNLANLTNDISLQDRVIPIWTTNDGGKFTYEPNFIMDTSGRLGIGSTQLNGDKVVIEENNASMVLYDPSAGILTSQFIRGNRVYGTDTFTDWRLRSQAGQFYIDGAYTQSSTSFTTDNLLTFNAGFSGGRIGIRTNNAQAILDVSGDMIIRDDVSMTGFNEIDIYFPTDASGINARVRDISQNLADLSGVVDTNTVKHLYQSSSGVYSGGKMSLASTTSIDISAGAGLISDLSGVTIVQWNDILNYTIPNISTNDFTQVYIDKTGNIHLENTSPTSLTRRQYVYLGKLIHSGSTLNLAFNQPQVIRNGVNGIHEYFENISNFIVMSGGKITANEDLHIDIDFTRLFGIGINFVNEVLDPNIVEYSEQSNLTFSYRLVGSSVITDSSLIDPNQYEPTPFGSTTAVPSNKFTNQRIFIFPSGRVAVQYGQTLYNKLVDAVDAIPTEPFVLEQNIEDNAVLIAVLTVQEGTTALNNETQAIFTKADQFGRIGNGGGIGGGAGITDLQTAYTFEDDGYIELDGSKPFGVQDNSQNILFSVNNDDTITLNATVDLSCNVIQDVSQITFCVSGSFIEENSTYFDISSSKFIRADTVIVDTTNHRLGVGTETPQRTLHVAHNSSSTLVALQNTQDPSANGNNVVVSFRTPMNGDAFYESGAIQHRHVDLSSSQIQFYTTDNLSLNPVITLKRQYVGVNVEDPSYILHVKRVAGKNPNVLLEGDSRITGAPKLTFQDISGDTTYTFQQVNQSFQLLNDNLTDPIVQTWDTSAGDLYGRLAFFDKKPSYSTVQGVSNQGQYSVGIGVWSSSSSRASQSFYLFGQTGQTSSGNASRLTFHKNNGADYATAGALRNDDILYYIWSYPQVASTGTVNYVRSSEISARMDNDVSNNRAPTALTFWTMSQTENNTERMRISSTGLVGINNTAPSNQLTVGDNDGSGYGMSIVNDRYGAIIKTQHPSISSDNNPLFWLKTLDTTTSTTTTAVRVENNRSVSINRQGVNRGTGKVYLDVSGKALVNCPEDYWQPTGGYIGIGQQNTQRVGQIDHHGSYAISMTSNGYRTGSGWTSYNANGEVGASQITCNPLGRIELRTDASKNLETSDITLRMTVTDDAVGVNTSTPLNFINTKFQVKNGSIVAGDTNTVAGNVAIYPYYQDNNYTCCYGAKQSSGGALVGYGVRSTATNYTSIDSLSLSRTFLHVSTDLEWWTGTSGAYPIGNTVPNMTRKFYVDNAGNIYATSGTVNVISEGKKKVDVQPILTQTTATFEDNEDVETYKQEVNTLYDKVQQMDGVEYGMITQPADKKMIGLSASNINNVFPSLISKTSDGSLIKSGDQDMMTVNYNGMIGVLLETIKALQEEVKQLKNVINVNDGNNQFQIPTKYNYTSSYSTYDTTSVRSVGILKDNDIQVRIVDQAIDPLNNRYYIGLIDLKNDIQQDPEFDTTVSTLSFITKIKASGVLDLDFGEDASGVTLFFNISNINKSKDSNYTTRVDKRIRVRRVIYDNSRNQLFIGGKYDGQAYSYSTSTNTYNKGNLLIMNMFVCLDSSGRRVNGFQYDNNNRGFGVGSLTSLNAKQGYFIFNIPNHEDETITDLQLNQDHTKLYSCGFAYDFGQDGNPSRFYVSQIDLTTNKPTAYVYEVTSPLHMFAYNLYLFDETTLYVFGSVQREDVYRNREVGYTYYQPAVIKLDISNTSPDDVSRFTVDTTYGVDGFNTFNTRIADKEYYNSTGDRYSGIPCTYRGMCIDSSKQGFYMVGNEVFYTVDGTIVKQVYVAHLLLDGTLDTGFNSRGILTLNDIPDKYTNDKIRHDSIENSWLAFENFNNQHIFVNDVGHILVMPTFGAKLILEYNLKRLVNEGLLYCILQDGTLNTDFGEFARDETTRAILLNTDNSYQCRGFKLVSSVEKKRSSMGRHEYITSIDLDASYNVYYTGYENQSTGYALFSFGNVSDNITLTNREVIIDTGSEHFFEFLSMDNERRILMSGEYQWIDPSTNTLRMNIFLQRYLSSGVLDTTFGESGTIRFNASMFRDYPFQRAFGIRQDPTDPTAYYVIGQVGNDSLGELFSSIYLLRIYENGVLDASFGDQGGYTITTMDMRSGEATWNIQFDLSANHQQHDMMRILLSGYVCLDGENEDNVKMFLVCYNQYGFLDSTFVSHDASLNSYGLVVPRIELGTDIEEYGYNVVVQQGRYVLSGDSIEYGDVDYSFNVGIYAYLPSGAVDTSFGDGGRTMVFISSYSQENAGTHEMFSMNQDHLGRIVIVGHDNFQCIVVRLDTSGNLDTTFGDDGITRFTFEDASNNKLDTLIFTSSIDESGQIYIGGYTVGKTTTQTSGNDEDAVDIIQNDVIIARVNEAGRLDTTFGDVRNGNRIGYHIEANNDVDQIYYSAYDTVDNKLYMCGYRESTSNYQGMFGRFNRNVIKKYNL